MSINNNLEKVIIPPLKIQGIKTKLIPFINESVKWNQDEGTWYEPFLGSGSVLFNIQPKNAIISDINPHIIQFYNDLKYKIIDVNSIKNHLLTEGEQLLASEGEHYYEVRKRFNANPNSLDYLFLNRSCFNGMMRFNRKGEFNVPFCRKPDRFRQAYITKIVNQTLKVQTLIDNNNWTFKNCDWKDAIKDITDKDFIYLDPPYIGRSTDYFSNWSAKDAIEMSELIQLSEAGWALSMWKSNKYRCNNYLNFWNGYEFITNHFYHLGSKEKNRNEVLEVLMVKKGNENLNFTPKDIAKQIEFNF